MPNLEYLKFDPVGWVLRRIYRLGVSRTIRHWYRRWFVPTLNIRSNAKDWRAAILSNLAETPLVIDGIFCRTLESFLQAIKFSNEQEQQEILTLSSKEALRRGRTITEVVVPGETKVYWRDNEILYGSVEHRLLLIRAIQAKIDQNEQVRLALLETGECFCFTMWV